MVIQRNGLLVAGPNGAEIAMAETYAEIAKSAAARILHLDESLGAVGDGITDDSGALAAAIALLPDGGIIRGVPGWLYFFADPPALPRGIRLIGQTAPGKPRSMLPTVDAYASAIVLPAGKSVTVTDQAELDGWLLWRQGLVTPTYPTIDTDEALAIIADYDGLAVHMTGDDAVVSNNLILGFDQAIKAEGVFRPKIFNNHIDCRNGIQATQIYDCGEGYGVWSNRCWPYLIGSQPYPWRVNRRNGRAFYFHDGADGLIARGNFAYGYDVQMELHEVYAMRVEGWNDNIAFVDPTSVTGCIGIKTSGNCNNTVFTDVHVDAQDINFYFAHDEGYVVVQGVTAGIAKTTQFKFGPGSNGTIRAIGNGAVGGAPIQFETGVGYWSGEIVCTSTSTQIGRTAVADFTAADRAKIRGVTIRTDASTLSNDLNGGTSAVPSLVPHPYINSGLFLNGAAAVALSVTGKAVMNFARSTNSVNFLATVAADAGNRVLVLADGTDTNVDLQVSPKGSGVLFSGGHVLPTSDNALSLGVSGTRWSSVWAANGTIQTSDPRQKTDLEAIDPALALLLVQLIDPITFRWKSGGLIAEAVEREVEEQVTETVTDVVEDIELVDGRAVVTLRSVEREELVFDLIEVVDENGLPVMIDFPPVFRRGELIQPARQEQRKHRVPRMRTVLKPVTELVDRPGDRTHWGFNAAQVQSAFEIVEKDFGGFVISEDGSLALRPDQMIPILWAALRGVLAGVPVPAVPDHPAFDSGGN